jgi:lipopolysaccharide assembly outer membrane protein LptD (OstA)
MKPRATTLLFWLLPLALLLSPTTLPATVEPSPAADALKAETPSSPAGSGKLPGDVAVEALKIRELPGSEGYVLEDAVNIRSGRSRIQADRVTYRAGRWIEAEGNVLVVWGGNRIAGTRMAYDLKEERGTLENAIGQVEPDFFFIAKTAEKIGQDLVVLKTAVVTTCTQPVPYWSLAVSTATIRIDGYAHLWNLRLRTRDVPIFYAPYVIWPVKKGRAAGLLLPSFGTSQERGRIINLPLYFPIGPSVDLTLTAERYSLAGLGWGTEFGFIPNRQGSGKLSAFYIEDEVAHNQGEPSQRYRATFTETQQFQNGFRMVADVNQVSDFNYFTDYERDLTVVSTPTILARVDFSRNGSWTSINVRDLRREQLKQPQAFYVETQPEPVLVETSFVQETLPEVEFRGRSHRLGKTPFYLSFESSAAWIRQSDLQFRTATYSDADQTVRHTYAFPLVSDYYRADVYPTISAPVSPFPWLDITPSVNTRYTFYTQSQTTRQRELQVAGQPTPAQNVQEIEDNPLGRFVNGATVDMVGPKFFRIFERPDNPFSSRYKNVIEPRILYVYQQAFDRNEEIIHYDEVDSSRGATNQLTYGLRTRLFAARPRTKPAARAESGEAVLLPEGTSGEVKKAEPAPEGAAAPAEPAAPAPVEPVEIASLEISQSRSFGTDLSTGINSLGVHESSRYSSVDTVGRFNPKPSTSLDLRTSYDILLRQFSSVSLSGSLRGPTARTGFSVVRTEGSSGASGNMQLRMAAGVTLFGKKLKLDVDGSYNAQQHRVPDQRWRVEYYTQCCGFLMEWFQRDFVNNNRGEFRFTVDLRGIGKLVDLHQ